MRMLYSNKITKIKHLVFVLGMFMPYQPALGITLNESFRLLYNRSSSGRDVANFMWRNRYNFLGGAALLTALIIMGMRYRGGKSSSNNNKSTIFFSPMGGSQAIDVSQADIDEAISKQDTGKIIKILDKLCTDAQVGPFFQLIGGAIKWEGVFNSAILMKELGASENFKICTALRKEKLKAEALNNPFGAHQSNVVRLIDGLLAIARCKRFFPDTVINSIILLNTLYKNKNKGNTFFSDTILKALPEYAVNIVSTAYQLEGILIDQNSKYYRNACWLIRNHELIPDEDNKEYIKLLRGDLSDLAKCFQEKDLVFQTSYKVTEPSKEIAEILKSHDPRVILDRLNAMYVERTVDLLTFYVHTVFDNFDVYVVRKIGIEDNLPRHTLMRNAFLQVSSLSKYKTVICELLRNEGNRVAKKLDKYPQEAYDIQRLLERLIELLKCDQQPA